MDPKNLELCQAYSRYLINVCKMTTLLSIIPEESIHSIFRLIFIEQLLTICLSRAKLSHQVSG